MPRKGRAFVVCGTAAAADTSATTPQATTTPGASSMGAEKPMIPSKAELPDSAFKKLDVGGKGYVTKDKIAAELIGAILDTAA